ncbi:hypothetical protein R6Q59_006905 [Mikania micrantha]
MRLGGLGLLSARMLGFMPLWRLELNLGTTGSYPSKRGVVGLDPDYQEALERLNVSLPDLDIGEYRSILKYRLMIPMYPEDETCPICRKACMDKYGEHAVHCKELPGFKYRHDWKRDVLWDILRRAGIFAKKEALVNFLTDPMEGRSTLRPADLLIFGWAGGNMLV